jgi:hypothetical protein
MVEQLATERQAHTPAEVDVQDRENQKTYHCPLHHAP